MVSIIGTRPQFIKYIPLSKEIRKSHEDVLIHTGQHYDYKLSKLFFDQMGIHQPEYNLNVGSCSHVQQISSMMSKLEDILIDEKPDIVFVYGDTNSTLAGALSSVKLNIPVGHIEAGLRSYDRKMPEELNRVITDHVSSLLFSPTETAVKNLCSEGITNRVYLVGDIMIDVFNNSLDVAKKSDVLSRLDMMQKGYCLLTLHRPSNTDNKEQLVRILNAVATSNKPVVFPVHPRTEYYIRKYKISLDANIHMVEPLGYFDFLWLEKNAAKILTDSGGIQKEAYLLNIPCITLRDNTEWVETVDEGWNVLVGSDKAKIITAITGFNPSGKQRNVFGKGGVCKQIIRYVTDV